MVRGGGRLRRTGIALLASVAVTAVSTVMAAYVGRTENPNNQISTGSVAVSDNDGANVPMYSHAADGSMAPNTSFSKCIRVTYTGTLTSAMKLYAETGIPGGQLFDLKIDRGTGLSGAFPSCTGFTLGSVAYTGLLSDVPTTYAGGIDAKSAGATWATNNTVDYRFTITARDDPTLDARRDIAYTAGHTFRWEARNT